MADLLGTCKVCKYWKRDTRELYRWSQYYGNCSSDKFQYEDPNGYDKETLEKDNLLYADYEGYSADFETGEDFGCIHWVSK